MATDTRLLGNWRKGQSRFFYTVQDGQVLERNSGRRFASQIHSGGRKLTVSFDNAEGEAELVDDNRLEWKPSVSSSSKQKEKDKEKWVREGIEPDVDKYARESSAEAFLKDDVERIRSQYVNGKICICISGATSFARLPSGTEALVQALADAVSRRLGVQVCLMTGGLKGVQETFAKSCSPGIDLLNVLPFGEASKYGAGKDIHAGINLKERMKVYGELGNIYVTIGGGPGVASEARDALGRGAFVLPVRRTGGASSGSDPENSVPAQVLEKPDEATVQEWDLLQNQDDSTISAAADAIAAILQRKVLRKVAPRGDLEGRCEAMELCLMTFEKRLQDIQRRLDEYAAANNL
jgi:predicted Rossmann-fold nucleotide-binding protein